MWIEAFTSNLKEGQKFPIQSKRWITNSIKKKEFFLDSISSDTDYDLAIGIIRLFHKRFKLIPMSIAERQNGIPFFIFPKGTKKATIRNFIEEEIHIKTYLNTVVGYNYIDSMGKLQKMDRNELSRTYDKMPAIEVYANYPHEIPKPKKIRLGKKASAMYNKLLALSVIDGNSEITKPRIKDSIDLDQTQIDFLKKSNKNPGDWL